MVLRVLLSVSSYDIENSCETAQLRYPETMSESRSQSRYQVRLGWGVAALSELAPSEIVVVVTALGDATELAVATAALPHQPIVLMGNLRNASATAQTIIDTQVATGSRTPINLVLLGTHNVPGASEGQFAVEDYLAAGAIADALTARGIDHSAPDVAVAAEGFRALRRAVKHLLAASSAGIALVAAGERHQVMYAAHHDAEHEATVFGGPSYSG